MRSLIAIVTVVAALMVFPVANATEVNPISKVLQMISNLQGQVLSQSADAQKAYDKTVQYCQQRSQEVAFGIKTGKAFLEELQARVEEETASIGTLNAKIEDLSADLSSDENELKAAAALREKEAADFLAEESDLKEIMDSLEHAISAFSKTVGASMLQVKDAGSVTEALRVLVDATAMSSEDASKLTALVQERSLANSEEDDGDGDSDLELGAPAAAAYESHSGGVVGTLEGLYEKAESQLSKVRASEAKAHQNYEQLKQSLSNEIKFATQDMDKAKVGLAESQEAKSVAAGDLEMTTKDLQRDVASKELLHHECMTVAQDFETSVKARKETFNALAAAKKSIEESSGGATKQTYLSQVSFTQLTSRTESHATLGSVKFQVVHFVRRLAKKTKSAALAQLASRMSSALKLGASTKDPFGKVRGLIRSMISELEADAEAEASHKAYCDKELADTSAKKQDAMSELDSLTSKKDQKSARAVELREQMATLQKELAQTVKAKGELTQLRNEEEDIFKKHKAEMQQGLNGIRLALKILKEHFGKAVGSEGGVISLLEVVESDFNKGLAGLIVEEESAAAYYKSEAIPNIELEQATKETDLKFKTKEYMSLNKTVAEVSSDLAGVQSRLDAILEFDRSIKKACVDEPLSYDERQRRRKEEVAGLKEALVSLEGAALLQLGSAHKLRGARRHA